MTKSLTEKQREALETLGPIGMADCLTDLFYFEMEGFEDYIIADLVQLILDEINRQRKREAS